MKVLLKYVLILIGFIAVVFLLGGLIISKKWEVSRSMIINAEKSVVFEKIANLKNWPQWSPWEEEGENSVSYLYEGALSGKGAKMSWTSKSMGNGSVVIREADESFGIIYDLFIDMNNNPSKLVGRITYEEQPQQGLVVTWQDEAQAETFAQRWLSLIIRYVLKADFDKGLSNLKSVVEAK